MIVSAIALGLAIAAIWLAPLTLPSGRQLPVWPLFLGIAIAIGLSVGTLTPLGASIAVIACLIPAGRNWAAVRSVQRACAIMGVVVAFALAVRLLPGFPEVVFINGLRLSPDASPMRLTAHFDAGLAGLVLMAFYCQRIHTWAEARVATRPALAIGAITTLVVVTTAWAVGYVRPEVKLPSFTVWHLIKMLLWTCVMEEAFFRGVVQGGLAKTEFVRGRPHLRWLPLAAASLLFGLAHAAGGIYYVALAALAGLGYGYAFQVTGRIEASMLAHFMLNATHFIAFTYPSVNRG